MDRDFCCYLRSARTVDRHFVVIYGELTQWFEILSVSTVSALSGSRFVCHLWWACAADWDCVTIYGKRAVEGDFVYYLRWTRAVVWDLLLFMVSMRSGSRFCRYLRWAREVDRDFVVIYTVSAQWIEILLLFKVSARSGSRFGHHLYGERVVDRDFLLFTVSVCGGSRLFLIYGECAQWIEILSPFALSARRESRFCGYLRWALAVDPDIVAIRKPETGNQYKPGPVNQKLVRSVH